MAEPRPRSIDMYSDSFMLHSVAPRYSYYKHHAADLNSKMLQMKTKDEIRYENLQRLVKQAAGPSGDERAGLSNLVKSARERGRSLSRQYLYQVLTHRKTMGGTTRNIGDDFARKIEDALKLGTGWMDTDHASNAQHKSDTLVPAEEFADLVRRYGNIRADDRMIVISIMDSLSRGGAANVIEFFTLFHTANDEVRGRMLASMRILAGAGGGPRGGAARDRSE